LTTENGRLHEELGKFKQLKAKLSREVNELKQSSISVGDTQKAVQQQRNALTVEDLDQ